jgi:hypothetical protein
MHACRQEHTLSTNYGAVLLKIIPKYQVTDGCMCWIHLRGKTKNNQSAVLESGRLRTLLGDMYFPPLMTYDEIHRETEPQTATDVINDGDGATGTCGSQFLAANQVDKKDPRCDINGVFGSVCSHAIPLPYFFSMFLGAACFH